MVRTRSPRGSGLQHLVRCRVELHERWRRLQRVPADRRHLGREAEAAIGLRNQWKIAKGVRLHTGFERLHAIAGVEREATAASVGLEYLASARFKSTARLEWRNDSSSDSWLSTAGFAQRLSRNWTMLARNYYQLTVPEGTANQVQDRFSIGAAYRDTTANRLNLLTRYEFRVEDTPGLAPGTASDRRVQVVSTHADLHPARAWTLSGQYAAKFVDDRAEASADRFGIHLFSGRVGFDLSRRWDIGGLTSVMFGGAGGHRSAVGGESGSRSTGTSGSRPATTSPVLPTAISCPRTSPPAGCSCDSA